MRAIIKDEVRELQITTVTLAPEYDDPKMEKVYIFHCPRCGNKLIQYKGFVASILPGMAPVSLPVILKCSNNKCNQKYAFSGFAQT